LQKIIIFRPKIRPIMTLVLQNYINGQLVPPHSGQYLPCVNPATADSFANIPDSDAQDVQQAIIAAEQAFVRWAATPAEQRAKILLRIADLIDENFEKLALAETTDNGKPLNLSKKMDIPRAATNLRFFATAILHTHTETYLTDNQALNYVLRQPLGVVACISPWNLPLYLLTWKIAPALAAGNCVVAKPSEVTPCTAYYLSELCIAAGLPAGVLNIVHGLGSKAGEALVKHPQIKAVSFTGGTQTGKHLASIVAPTFKKMSLELGGKNATLVFESADIMQAATMAVKAAFTNQGQICLCGSRILVQQSIYEQFKAIFIEKTKQLCVGDPLLPETTVGAVVSAAHFDKVRAYIALAKQEGGTVLCGGEALQIEGRCEKGYFIQPTVIEGLDQYCRTNQEEIFGAVATLQPFDDEAQAIQWANATPYGLAASVWTTHLTQAHRVAAQLQSGIVWINCWLLRDLRTPFGGMKQSGVGREGGMEALHFFTETKNVCVAMG
jgi:aminomuconate-semialdehyde/2-hydroxymuconate-6-semialdehyde dehydrogenase